MMHWLGHLVGRAEWREGTVVGIDMASVRWLYCAECGRVAWAVER